MLGPVRTPSLFQRHRALRWLAPVGVLGVVGLAAGGMITAKASTSDPLPDTTVAELIADLQSASVGGFSGTIVTQMSLGLPELPAVTGERGGSSMASLLAGSHTMRLWYGGPTQQRLALLGQTSETDVFHSNRDLWEWDSDTHVATHTVLPADTKSSKPTQSPSVAESMTPQQIASELLSSVDPTTKVTLGDKRSVADRSAYDLVLTPRDVATRIGSVHIAIDGSTKLPLAVEVYARGRSAAAIDVAFSDISFKSPPAGYFSFAPPPGAAVHTNTASQDSPIPGTATSGEKVTTSGKGWSTVVEYRASAAQVKQLTGPGLGALTSVTGAWGHGRLIDSTLFSALILDDGRVFAGAVGPDALYAAASSH
jgi:outer membrane lipoprotein-sorting protein